MPDDEVAPLPPAKLAPIRTKRAPPPELEAGHSDIDTDELRHRVEWLDSEVNGVSFAYTLSDRQRAVSKLTAAAVKRRREHRGGQRRP